MNITNFERLGGVVMNTQNNVINGNDLITITLFNPTFTETEMSYLFSFCDNITAETKYKDFTFHTTGHIHSIAMGKLIKLDIFATYLKYIHFFLDRNQDHIVRILSGYIHNQTDYRCDWPRFKEILELSNLVKDS